ncbi:hypothetical protein C161_27553 [Paenibacillus sp. FSL R5-192]|uniref:hypothetical protein n=1 Tax=Paenibacillus sp. FSL R5-192 TaxID=1226754 RepID=UPI0003E29655|nr:hypothetical protein [Paenibacillus sp. FSL R5-192]ETT30284.1 hypothetical protein C161_27553 [Paenibacillus sp. FSL R5-192]
MKISNGHLDTVFKSTSMSPENAEVRYFGGVIAYFFPGAAKTKPDGSDRFRTDMMKARDIWDIPLVGVSSIDLTHQEANDINLQQNDLDCDSSFLNDEGPNNQAREKMAIRRHRDYVDLDLFGNWISVWYVPFATFSNGTTIGCAWPQVGNPVYHYIIMAEDSNTSDNHSALAHEIGHILFGTVSGQNNSDPTGPSTTVLIPNDDGSTFKITPSHSLKKDNVMYPNAGNNTGIEITQREKAAKSRILTGIAPPSVWDK